MATTSSPHNLTGLLLFIDTHIIDATDEAATCLRRLREEGWINLHRTDAMDTELADAPPDKWAALTEASAAYPEALGPLVLDHSRLNHAVLGSSEDAETFGKVFATLFPGVASAPRKNHIRDAMHVSTAMRYGGYGFVTREKRLLNKAGPIAERFKGFRMWSPEDAVAEALARVRRARELHRREPERGPLPAWPTETDLRTRWCLDPETPEAGRATGPA